MSERSESYSQWRLRFERYRNWSGTVSEFCQDEGVGLTAFYRWKRKFNGRTEQATSAEPEALLPEEKFLPIKIQQLAIETLSTEPLTLQLPGGGSVELPSKLSRKQLTDIFAACVDATGGRSAATETNS
jgi:transposase-like protein